MSLALTFSLHFSDRIEACSNQPIGNSFTKDSVSVSFMGLIEPLNFERLVLEPSILHKESKDVISMTCLSEKAFFALQ